MPKGYRVSILYDSDGNAIATNQTAAEQNAIPVNPPLKDYAPMIAGVIVAWAVGGWPGAILGAFISRGKQKIDTPPQT